MAFELHVWGPAFGLPSIDAECLAAITYLSKALPKEAWIIVPSSDPSVSPAHALPALRRDDVWISGYAAIVTNISRMPFHNLDARLSSSQLADLTAYGAYLGSRARTLVDLSLYVSAANWAETTRPAFSAILPFPLGWAVPPTLRAAAVERVERLGFTELDADFDPDEPLADGRKKVQVSLPQDFLVRGQSEKKGVLESMVPEERGAVTLFGLADACLGTLDTIRPRWEDGKEKQKRRFFPDGELSSLDCLVFGYLVLMTDPVVPRNWLQTKIQNSYPELYNFVTDMKSTVLPSNDDLPWAGTPPSALRTGQRLLHEAAVHVPVLGSMYSQAWREQALSKEKGSRSMSLLFAAGVMLFGAVVGGSYMLYSTSFGERVQTWQSDRKRSRLSEFGELGSMLEFSFGAAERKTEEGELLTGDQVSSVIADTEAKVD